MTPQQELELLAEWLGIEWNPDSGYRNTGVIGATGVPFMEKWNPSPEGNDTDFLNMVAGVVWFLYPDDIEMVAVVKMHAVRVKYADHNNDKLAAMKHAAYQVCLMAAKEWKEGQ